MPPDFLNSFIIFCSLEGESCKSVWVFNIFILNIKRENSFFSEKPPQDGTVYLASNAAPQSQGGASAGLSPQTGLACCRTVQPRYLRHPLVPAGPQQRGPRSPQEPGSDQEEGGRSEGFPLPPAGRSGNDGQDGGGMGGQVPGLRDGGGPDSHSTGDMQGWIWEVHNMHKHTQTQAQNKVSAWRTSVF